MAGSWAASSAERDEWTAFVRQVRGSRLAVVRYVTIDYRRHELGIDMRGARTVVDRVEWEEPPFDFPGGHTLDYGVEFEMAGGSIWSVTWDPPGITEGLAVYRSEFIPDLGDVAVWDVSSREPWVRCLGQPVTDVDPQFEPWGHDDDTWWCRVLGMLWPRVSVRLLEAEGAPDGSVGPSADNIVVQWGTSEPSRS